MGPSELLWNGQKGGGSLGALLAGLVLGAFVLAAFVVVVLNVKQTPLPPVPTAEERLERIYRIGGDAR